MKYIIVFGVSGNIGQYLAEYLVNACENNYKIIGVDIVRPLYVQTGIEYITININNPDEYSGLPQSNVYAVIDLIGPMPARMEGYHPEEYVQTNVLGSCYLFQYAIKVGADRILYTKSFCDILKRAEKQLFLHVNDEPLFDYNDYHSVYCVTQLAAKELLKCMHEFYGIKTFVFRLPHIYLWSGNDQYNVKGIPQKMMHRIIIDKAIAGEPIEVWGDHTRKKDMVYVKDLCYMLYLACFVNRNDGFYNVGTGIGIQLLEQIEGIRDVFGEEKKSELLFCPEKPNAPQYIMDIKEAIDELGYSPRYSYIEMLKDMKKEMKLGRF